MKMVESLATKIEELDLIQNLVKVWHEQVPNRPTKVYIFEIGKRNARVSERYVKTGEEIASANISLSSFYPLDESGQKLIRSHLLWYLSRYKEREGVRR